VAPILGNLLTIKQAQQIAQASKANQEVESHAAAQDITADHHRRHDPGLCITPMIKDLWSPSIDRLIE